MVSTKFSSILAITAAANALTLASLSSPVSATPRVDPAVHRTLRQQTTVNLIVTLKDGTASPLNAVQEASFETRGDKIQALVDRLQKHAATSQSEVTKVAAQESGGATPLFSEATSFWISNQLFFKDATLELVEKLAGLPSVSAISEEQVHPLVLSAVEATEINVTINVTSAILPASLEWGVKKVQAPEVWAKGYTGQGIVVGSIDTGVRATHDILRNNWRKDHGRFDPMDKRAEPYDDDGHGSHTLGTAVGSNGFGVAPGATWIGCKACGELGCPQSALLACGQFMLCPTDPDGKNADCSKAPHVVNNSWGGGSSDFYVDAGIIPVFCSGNDGYGGCSTAQSPSDFPNVVGVGATNTNDKLAGLSSKGPSQNGLIKPDISAPGISVRSAAYTGDADYRTADGTSEATPHVVGVIALALSANRNLTFSQVRDILTTTTVRSPTLQASGYTCGGTPDTTYPNNQYGYGRVDALAATLKAAAMK